MGKGRRPRPSAKVPNVTARQQPKGQGHGTQAGTTVSKGRCWTFVLVDTTTAVKTARVGTRVRGAVLEARIAVMASGVLGYAPDRESKEMIKALGQSQGALLGEIVSEAKDTKTKATLCLS
jgi:hypothetical protein